MVKGDGGIIFLCAGQNLIRQGYLPAPAKGLQKINDDHQKL
jgi:hypothetical protein